MDIKPGLYEQLVTKHLQQAMARIDPPLKAVCSKLDPGESPFVIGQYLGQNISNLLTRITGKNKLKKQGEALYSSSEKKEPCLFICQRTKKDKQSCLGIFAENIRDGFTFDPIEVAPCPDKPGIYRLLDGAHRWSAYKSTGATGVDVDIKNLDGNDPLLYAATKAIGPKQLTEMEYFI